jgi:hypothetical protein
MQKLENKNPSSESYDVILDLTWFDGARTRARITASYDHLLHHYAYILKCAPLPPFSSTTLALS